MEKLAGTPLDGNAKLRCGLGKAPGSRLLGPVLGGGGLAPEGRLGNGVRNPEDTYGAVRPGDSCFSG